MSSKKKKSKKSKKAGPEITRKDDGAIVITYKIPFKEIKEKRDKVAEELGKDVEVPGFRKGKAPANKVVDQIPEHTLIEQTLGRILPQMVGKTIKNEDIKPAMYPKFDLVSAEEGEDWVVRATTCEMPKVELGDYKKKIKGTARAKSLWTPDKGSDKDKKGPSQQEKEQAAIQALIEAVDIKIPEVLIRQEVDVRLSRLLDRIQNLGLSLESYLSSIGKNAEELRGEYSNQAKDAITLELALEKIAQEEGVKIEKEDVDKMIEASSGDKELSKKLDTPQQRQQIEAVLRKRAALQKITSYL